MEWQKRVLSPSVDIGADAKTAPYCVANLAKALSITVVLRLVWNSFSNQQCLFVNVQHALLMILIIEPKKDASFEASFLLQIKR